MQLSQLAVPGAQPNGTVSSLPSFQSQQEQQQQPHRPERLPRCSTVSLQTEIATPSLVVFSGGTAFNSVAGESVNLHNISLNTHTHTQLACAA